MDILFQEMEKSGIEAVCLMGVPLQKVWGEHAAIRPEAYESDDGRVYYYSTTDLILARDILVRRHPDRFLVGSDVVGRFAKLKDSIDEERRFLSQLPPEIARKVAWGNAVRLFPRP